MVLSSVVGMIHILGWKLGVTESLAMDLFVGFSVDYIVHVAHEYLQSPLPYRGQRVLHLYKNIGVAVFSGACTTLISATILLFTKLYVLNKFGILIQITIGFSLIYSLLVMPAMFYLIGPQRKQGDLIYYVFNPILRKIGCKKRAVEEDDTDDEDDGEIIEKEIE